MLDAARVADIEMSPERCRVAAPQCGQDGVGFASRTSESGTCLGFCPLPSSTNRIMRPRSRWSNFSATVSVIRRLAAYAVSIAIRHTTSRMASIKVIVSS
jgi:hypothetical protein